MKRNRIVLIGIDGLTLDLIGEWLEKGYLPHLSQLISSGASGELQSTIPPVTPTAIASFMTGQNPGKHGVYDFFQRRWGQSEWQPVNASFRDGPAFWDILDQAGKRCIILNVPLTYPPTPVDGLMVSGFLTPRGKRDFAYPPYLLDEIESRFGPYRLHLERSYDGHDAEPLLQEVFDELDYKSKVALYLMEQHEWDVFVLYLMGTDRVQHELWQFLEVQDGENRHALFNRILAYYQAIDAHLAKLVDAAGDATVFVFSDHGFGPVTEFLNFNVWLLEQGFLRLKTDRATRLKRFLHRMGFTPLNAYRVLSLLRGKHANRERDLGSRSRLGHWLDRIFLSFEDVDWQETRAYSRGNFGQIYLNLKGRELEGSVAPEKQPQVVSEICGKLGNVQADRPVSFDLFKKEDIYTGPHVNAAPEIIPVPVDMALKALGTLAFPSNRFIDKNTYGLSGDHRPNGVLVCCGETLKRGAKVSGANIVDIAPTILYLMGQDIPESMDGRVLTEIFAKNFLTTHPVRYRADCESRAVASNTELPEEDILDIEERLRGLGYLG